MAVVAVVCCNLLLGYTLLKTDAATTEVVVEVSSYADLTSKLSSLTVDNTKTYRIKMMADILNPTLTSYIRMPGGSFSSTVSSTKYSIWDLNGHTFTPYLMFSDCYLFLSTAVEITDSSSQQTGKLSVTYPGNYNFQGLVSTGGPLAVKISGGTIDCGSAPIGYENNSVTGSLVISGGTVRCGATPFTVTFGTYNLHYCGGAFYKNGTLQNYNYTSKTTTTKAATCTAAGEKTETCNYCGTVSKTTIAALGHNYTNKVTAPTCTAQGYTTHTCSRCNDSYKDTYTNALGHSYTDTKTPATCTTAGYTTHKCIRCSVTYTDSPVAATGHNYTLTAETKPTCTANGSQTHTCQNCGDTQTQTLAAIGHDYHAEVIDPTCTEDGYTLHTCENCGDEYQDNFVDALGHEWGNWVITIPPTTENEGEMQRKCQVCGEIETKTLPRHEHDYVDEVVPPTCTEDGYTRHQCTECDYYYDDEIVPALGHEWSEWEVVTPPTTESEGEEQRRCQICGEIETRPIPQLAPAPEKGGMSWWLIILLGSASAVCCATGVVIGLIIVRQRQQNTLGGGDTPSKPTKKPRKTNQK